MSRKYEQTPQNIRATFWGDEFSTLLRGGDYLRISDGSANIEYHLIATYTENSYIEYLKTFFYLKSWRYFHPPPKKKKTLMSITSEDFRTVLYV